jgi:hypothetical protein
MEQAPNLETPIISMSKEEFDILRKSAIFSENNQAQVEIAEKYGIKPSAEQNASIRISVDGEILDIVTWKEDFGTVIETD